MRQELVNLRDKYTNISRAGYGIMALGLYINAPDFGLATAAWLTVGAGVSIIAKMVEHEFQQGIDRIDYNHRQFFQPQPPAPAMAVTPVAIHMGTPPPTQTSGEPTSERPSAA